MDETRENDIFIFQNDIGCYKSNGDGTFTSLTLTVDQLQPGAVGYNISQFMRDLKIYLTMTKNDNDLHNAAVLALRKHLNTFIHNIHSAFPDGEYYFFEFLQFCDYVEEYLNCQTSSHLECETLFVQRYNEFIKSSDFFKILPSLSFKPKSRKKSLKKSLKTSPKKSLKTSPKKSLKKSLKTSRKKAPKKAAR